MAKTIVFKDNSQLGELVIGEKHVHYHGTPSSEQKDPSSSRKANEVEDIEYEEVNTFCSYLSKEGVLAQHVRTPMEVQQQLEDESRKEAKDFVEFLSKNKKIGYFDFKGHSTRKIFHTLRDELPMMRQYGESNFYAAVQCNPL